MKKLLIAASVLAFTAAPVLANEVAQVSQASATAGVQLKKGQMVYGGNGRRIGKIFRVSPAGDAQIIIGTRLVTVPASTISEAEGKLSTSLTSKDLAN